MVPRGRRLSGIVLGLVVTALTALLLPRFEASPLPIDKKRKEEPNRQKSIPIIDVPRRWLPDVASIITDEERAAFKKLTTDEEREQFIEQFWERRNPEPGSPENKFKKEYYRRVVFANQRFSCDVPGWKTDRGRIYILYGPPDEIESHPNGGATLLPEAGGQPQAVAYPYQVWRYRKIEGLGFGAEVKFADATGTGDFQRVLEAGKQDMLESTPERFGFPRWWTSGLPEVSAEKGEPKHLYLYMGAYKPAPGESPELRAVIASKLAPPQAIPVSLRTYAVAATEETDLNIFTIDVPNRRLRFQRQGDVMRAGLEVYGQLITLSGRIMQVFEQALAVNVPDKDFPEWNNRNLVYQEAVPVHPGVYKLSVVVKDTQSGQMGMVEKMVRIPRIEADMLNSSSLILADEMGWPENDGGASDPFLVGGNRVVPNNDQVFSRKKGMGIYVEIYGLGIDPATHKTSAGIEFLILREGKTVLDQIQEIHDRSVLYVVQRMVHLNESLLPGDYQLELRITDHIRNQTISPSTTFKLL